MGRDPESNVGHLKLNCLSFRETQPVKPVSKMHVNAIKSHVSRRVWALDLNMIGNVWAYTPADHKTTHDGHRRTVFIGSRAQAVIRLFLASCLMDADLFNPGESEAEWCSNYIGPVLSQHNFQTM